MDRTHWEHGSEFHWLDFPPEADAPLFPWGDDALLMGTGRHALRGLLEHGTRHNAWSRLWVPSYFCPEVTASLASTGIPLSRYVDSPLESEARMPQAARGEVVLVVNYFGLRSRPAGKAPDGVTVVEDHTHDPVSPWALTSTADYCVASLRKTLPLPDGGVLWSPSRRSLPAQPRLTEAHDRVSHRKLAAMVLKRRFLDHPRVGKERYRALSHEAEIAIDTGPPSAMSPLSQELLRQLPAESWREARMANFLHLAEQLRNVGWLRFLAPFDSGCRPFSAVAVVDTPERRDRLRERLIDNDIYPAVLWALETEGATGTDPAALDLSRRVLSLHCDMRYSLADMDRVAETVASLGGGGR